MQKEQGDKPILGWETVNTTRDKQGFLNSEYLVERAKVPGGWLVGRWEPSLILRSHIT